MDIFVCNYKNMRNSERLIWGILLTTIVFLISTFVGARLNLNIAFFNASFGTDMLMLILSIGLIYGLKKYVRYRIALPRFSKILKSATNFLELKTKPCK